MTLRAILVVALACALLGCDPNPKARSAVADVMEHHDNGRVAQEGTVESGREHTVPDEIFHCTGHWHRGASASTRAMGATAS